MKKINESKLNPKVATLMKLVLDMKGDIPEAGLLAIVNYTLGETVSGVRGKIQVDGGRDIPLNIFSMVFMNSGFGKDYSLNALNKLFVTTFEESMIKQMETAKAKYWAGRKLQLEDEGYGEFEDIDELVKEEFKSVTPLSYRISNGTEAGVGKARYTHGLYHAGAVNLVLDEFGAVYQTIKPLMATMLSTYEDGNTNAKQLKEGGTKAVKGVPSNFLAYSAPSLVFDGGSNEKMLMADLSQGLARRCWYAYETEQPKMTMSPTEIVQARRDNHNKNEKLMKKINAYFGNFIETVGMYPTVSLPFESEVQNETYKSICKKNAEKLDNEAERSEMSNRDSKALRLAGIYAVIEKSSEITVEHLEQAQYVADLSGEAFKKIVNQPQIFERMFRFMVDRPSTTEVDLESQKWYSGNAKSKVDLLQLTKIYGYSKDYLFRIKETEGINFYSFTPMPKTNPNNVIISASNDITKGYKALKVSFDELYSLVTKDGFMYSAGTFKGGHRNKANYKQEQNLIIIDIDDGLKLETAKLMLSDYKCLIATTKSHQKEKNGIKCDRYRIIFIADRTIKLDSDTYGEFMRNVFDSLGVPADKACSDSSRFYYGAAGEYWYSSGERLIAIEPLIPNGEKANNTKARRESIGYSSLGSLEQFYISEEANGRNHALIKYAFVLHGEGYDYDSAVKKIESLNEKFEKPLPIKEIKSTILKTLKGRYNDSE